MKFSDTSRSNWHRGTSKWKLFALSGCLLLLLFVGLVSVRSSGADVNNQAKAVNPAPGDKRAIKEDSTSIQTQSLKRGDPALFSKQLQTRFLEAARKKSIQEFDQTLVELLQDTNLTDAQKFDVLWALYKTLKSSNLQSDQLFAEGVIDSLSAVNPHFAVPLLAEELGSGIALPGVKNSLMLTLTRLYDHTESQGSTSNNAAIAAALKMRLGDSDRSVSGAAALNYAIVSGPTNAIPALDAALANNALAPWEYATTLVHQIVNVRDQGAQLVAIKKLADFLAENSEDKEVRNRTIPALIEQVTALVEYGNLNDQSKAVLQRYLQTINPINSTDTRAGARVDGAITLEQLNAYAQWFAATSRLAGKSLEQAFIQLAGNQQQLNASPESAAALLLSEKGDLFLSAVRSQGNGSILAAALIRKAGSLPQPHPLADQFRALAARVVS